MKTLIAFATHHGTTARAAELLKNELGADAIDLVNIKKQKITDLSAYNTVIVGGSIHAGNIQGAVKKFCETHKDALLTKKTGYFICCMDRSEKEQEQLRNSYPAALLEKAIATGCFGGEFRLDKMNFIEKAIIKKIAKISESVSDIKTDAIKAFANSLKA